MRSRFVIITVLLGMVFSSGCFSFNQRKISSSNDSNVGTVRNHFVVTIHGIGGINSTATPKERQESTFGYLDVTLKHHLGQIRPQEYTQVLAFQYPTGENDKTTFDFAYQNLNQFLANELPKRGFKPEDRITFIAHSQGGLVATIWYVGIKLGLDQNGNPAPQFEDFKKYADATERIITVGTPFWGSKLATALLAKEGLDVETQTWVAGLLDLGIRELKEMSFLSNTIYKFRRTSIALSRNEELKKIFEGGAELINIGGVFPEDSKKLFYPSELVPDQKGFNIARRAVNFLTDKMRRSSLASEKLHTTETYRTESDIAVIIPSGRSQFIYADHTAQCRKENFVSRSEFESAQILPKSKYLLTESIHTPLLAPRSVGQVFIPEFCKDPNTCPHPTYRYILRYVAACDRQDSSASACDAKAKYDIIDRMFIANREDSKRTQDLSDARDLQGFSLEVSIRVPLDYELPITMQRYRPIPNEPDLVEWYLNQDLRSFQSMIKINTNTAQSPKYDLQNTLVEIKAPRKREYFSHLIDVHELTFRGERQKFVRLHLTGIIKPKPLTDEQFALHFRTKEEFYDFVEEEVAFPIQIQLPKPKHLDRPNDNALVSIDARIRPGFSTFIDLDYLNALDCGKRKDLL